MDLGTRIAFSERQVTNIPLRQSEKSGCEIKIQNAVRMLENIVCDISEKTNNNLISYNNSRTALAYAQIVTCLEENCTKPLTVSQIAKLCNISDSALKQTFKKYSGIGIMEYFNNIKINRAIGMLYAGASIKEISQNLGFCDPNYFSTVFKRITGVSPKKYINGQK